MPDIIIDITRHVGRAMQGETSTGVDRIGLAYVEHFKEKALALVRFRGRWLVLNKIDSLRIFTALLKLDKKFTNLIRFLIGKNYLFNWSRKSDLSLLLNVVHNGLEEASYVRQIKKRRLKPIFFLHDIIPITHPEYCRPGDREKHERRLETMLSTGRGIIVNSHDTERELATYATTHDSILPPCICAPIAPAAFPKPSPKRPDQLPKQPHQLPGRPLAAPYFVILGTIEARKNHLILLNIWRELAAELGEAAPLLIIIGRRGWECEQVIDMIERCQQIKELVIEKPNCNDAELATWLAHAQALLFPSFAEGFGLPLIEALSLKVPIIASDLPVFHEIAGDIPDYAHPLDALGWKQLIIDFTMKKSRRASAQLARMQGYKASTWDEHFAVVERFLKNAAI